MERKLDYKIIQNNFGVFADLKIKYNHNGVFDWKTTRYRDFVRIYVPSGSELVQVDGFGNEKVTTSSELGKTVFSAFVVTEPGNVHEISLRYKLAPKIVNDIVENNKYSLYLQKQAGSKYNSYNVELNFDKNINNYSPTGFFVKKENDKKIIWSDNFETDKEFKVLIK